MKQLLSLEVPWEQNHPLEFEILEWPTGSIYLMASSRGISRLGVGDRLGGHTQEPRRAHGGLLRDRGPSHQDARFSKARTMTEAVEDSRNLVTYLPSWSSKRYSSKRACGIVLGWKEAGAREIESCLSGGYGQGSQVWRWLCKTEEAEYVSGLVGRKNSEKVDQGQRSDPRVLRPVC